MGKTKTKYIDEETKAPTHFMDEGLERWLWRTAHRNHWRVAAWMSREDLIQDGYMCYMKCVDTYQRLLRKRRPRKDDRRNFMALVRTTFERHITDLANQRTLQRVEKPVSQLHHVDDTAEAWLERNGPVELAQTCSDLAELCKGAPAEVRNVVLALAGDTGEALHYLKIKGKRFTRRETNNEYLKRLAKTNKDLDMVQLINDHFGIQIAY